MNLFFKVILHTEDVFHFQLSHQAVSQLVVQTRSVRRVYVSVILVFKVTDTTVQVCVNGVTNFLTVKVICQTEPEADIKFTASVSCRKI